MTSLSKNKYRLLVILTQKKLSKERFTRKNSIYKAMKKLYK